MYLLVLFVCLLSFYIVTVYRLYHTHSLGSVEPTIALSESLWSRIVAQNKNKNKIKKSENGKFQKYLFLLCVCLVLCVCVVLFQSR